jgi:hypothetical protein
MEWRLRRMNQECFKFKCGVFLLCVIFGVEFGVRLPKDVPHLPRG